MKKVIITGATGFIGGALTERLLSAGVEVWAIVRSKKALEKFGSTPKLHIVEAAFTEYENLVQKIEEREFDVLFHMAWAGYGTTTNDCKVQIENILYTSYAVKAAAELEVKRFIFADSSHEFLMTENEFGEKHLCSIYGAAKQSAHLFCKTIAHNANMEFVSVLFTNIFGKGDASARSSNTLIRQLLQGKDLNLIDASKMHSWTYIDDCVEGVIVAAEKGIRGKMYYVGDKVRSYEEIMTEVRDIVNPDSKLTFGVYPDKTEIAFEQIDLEALHTDTGFECKTDFKENILKTVEWVKTLP